jgi:RNA polymerase sigma factor (TIGR02999 family)
VDRDVTQLLNSFDTESNSAEKLLPLVYDELRAIAQQRMAGERRDHTLEATALVHETYVRLVGGASPEWESRAHFFRVAAMAMRRILVDHARRKGSVKRGGSASRTPLALIQISLEQEPDDILAMEDALEVLETEDARAADIVQLRFYSGLSVEETARALGVSERTVAREWAFARARLVQLLGEGDATR